ncbi:MAG: hypothetical protein LBC85_07810 [Fibromonadaceae bacterium]|jgi:hypothetical protein|nr:hypothetical protein [Fibromonadaceae bacterium]
MRVKILFSLLFLAAFAFAESSAESKLSQIEARLDSLGEYAGSTVIGKDDSPVAVSGDFTVRFKHFDYFQASTMHLSRTNNESMRTLVNSGLNANIVVSPASYLTVFSSLYLPFDFTGFFANQAAFTPNSEGLGSPGERVQGFHPATDFYGASINENMTVGMDMRGGIFGATFLMGGVIWVNQSPLSMWERETSPRFVSQYELYEEEKVVSTYYKEKSFKPVKEGGRAFWTNRPFGGMLLDVHTLPWNLKGQLLFSQPNSIDIGTRDGLRLSSVDGTETELRGTYDYRGTAIGGRFAKEKIEFGQASLTVGANYMGVDFDAAQIYEREISTNYLNRADETIKFENLRVASVDLKGNLTPRFFLAFDLALSWDDTTVFRQNYNQDPSSSICAPNNFSPGCYNAKDNSSAKSTPAFGIYAKAQDKHWQPVTLEFIYLPKNFYSPYSMANPDRFPAWRKDQFYVGAGTYRYGPNMMGGNIKIEPEFNRGRFDFQYGIHRQVSAGDDVINFKYNLVGRQLWETSFSWTRHNPYFTLDSGLTNGSGLRYVNRLAGREEGSKYRLTDRTGGLRSGYGETWDAFTPYESVQDAFACAQIGHYVADSEAVCNLPSNVKWNSTVAVDMGYDIGHWFNTDRNIMLSLFTSLSGVSSDFIPVAYTDKYSKNMLMWSLFMQSEPAVAITPNLHGVLIMGFENFRAEKAYVGVSGVNDPAGSAYAGLYPFNGRNPFGNGAYFQLSPINILHTALGFGFDWDFAARAGLHFRYKYLTNNDENLPQNNWKAHHVQAETKVWF